MNTTNTPILITSALPYANGSIHIGHLVEYLQTDIYVRFLKLTGHDAVYMCADDTHGTPIMLRAKALGLTPEALIARFNEEHQRDFDGFHIHFDHFYSTNSEENRKHSAQIYERLKAGGHIFTQEVEGYYCETDGMFLSDRFVKGVCPKCGAQDQYGDVCEACGSHYDPVDLGQPRCATCGAPPVRKSSKHYFFRLSNFTNELRNWTSSANRLQPETLKSIQGWLESGLHDWDISRDAPYFGFNIPGETDKYFYVWLDAPVGYIATTENYCQLSGRSFKDYWFNPDTKIIHFIGKDIVYFHTLFWPAMLMGSGYNVPHKVCVHGFLTVNGEKMSKSRGTFINARTYLDHLDPQYLRYYYASKLTGSADDVDLNLDDFVDKVNADLVNNIVNLASRAISILNKNFDGVVVPLGESEDALLQDFFSGVERIRENYESREFARATRLILDIASRANKHFSDGEPWKLLATDPARAQNLCSFATQAFKCITTLLKPVLPQLAAEVEYILGLPDQIWEDAIRPLPSGHRLGKFHRLMERVDPIKVKAMVEASRAVPTPTPTAPEADVSLISAADFAKVDIRVGIIRSASEVPGSKQLYRLEVDIGRLVVVFAGIKPHYPNPAELVGKHVPVVANLIPRTFKNIGISEAMLLALQGPNQEIKIPFLPEDTEA
ncbi:MAG: methionine--tRNA ligase, partial [Calditrichota bacterium]